MNMLLLKRQFLSPRSIRNPIKWSVYAALLQLLLACLLLTVPHVFAIALLEVKDSGDQCLYYRDYSRIATLFACRLSTFRL